MTLNFSDTLAACAAMVLAFSSIGAIVSVPPAHAAALTGSPMSMTELA